MTLLGNNKNFNKPLIIALLFLILSLFVSASIQSEDVFYLIAAQIIKRIYPGDKTPILEEKTKLSPSDSSKEYDLYTVKAGDSLWKIAEKSQTRVEVLMALNKLTSPLIQEGQTLITPYLDLDLLARLVHSEAEGEPFEGQVAVASVVLNRLKDPRFPDTLRDVIYEKNAFQVVANGRINKPAGPNAVKAIEAALSGKDPSQGSIFFYNPAKIKGWNWVYSRKVIKRIGNHVFAS